ncbi:MAG: VWA domain-containing protein [Erysipelotrichaceae bacterium]|nr:VWA domain-containing protein [Erysipelotrichaceae bacterium]
MKKNLTEVVFIIDESGSMSGLEKDTVGGFNSTIKKQKEEEGECLVSTVFFNSVSRVLHDRIDSREISDMKEKDYYPNGCTALVDALGDSIKHIKRVHRYIREEDVPEKTLFVITTDGMENASRKYSMAQVKKMIEDQKEKGWEFIFLAANIDAYETARDYGIDMELCAPYVNDAKGNEVKFACMSEAISQVRVDGCISPDWNKAAKKDYKKRNK